MAAATHGDLAGVSAKGGAGAAVDRLRGRCLGFLDTSLECRGPRVSCTEAEAAEVRAWLQRHTPELADFGRISR